MMVTHRQRRRPWGGVTPMRLLAAVALSTAAVAVSGPPARADVVAYLVNVTVRPGDDFVNADDAIRYGQGVCDKVGQGRPFALIISDIKTDFNKGDEYQASYLISQAVNELCPALIWQLRNSAAHYRPSVP